MNAQQIVSAFDADEQVVTPEMRAALSSPVERQNLYKLLAGMPPVPFYPLVQAAFEKEVEFRKALWDGIAEDEGDFYEGIYRCAFLLYRAANPKDIHLLWKAKHLNMDVGSSMGAEFFIGGGLEVSIEFLEGSNLPESPNIATYIKGWFAQPDALKWQKEWEEQMLLGIQNA